MSNRDIVASRFAFPRNYCNGIVLRIRENRPMKYQFVVGICVLGSMLLLAAVGQEQNQSQKTDPAPPATQAPDSSTSQPSNSTEAKTKMIHTCIKSTRARLIHMEQPEYPLIAKNNHMCGETVLHATVEKDGSVTNLKYVSGPIVFTDAAIKAVKKWKYTPTLCDGDPVKVDTTIRVVFSLGSQCDSLTSPSHR
jgi:TonB family protein